MRADESQSQLAAKHLQFGCPPLRRSLSRTRTAGAVRSWDMEAQAIAVPLLEFSASFRTLQKLAERELQALQSEFEASGAFPTTALDRAAALHKQLADFKLQGSSALTTVADRWAEASRSQPDAGARTDELVAEFLLR